MKINIFAQVRTNTQTGWLISIQKTGGLLRDSLIDDDKYH